MLKSQVNFVTGVAHCFADIRNEWCLSRNSQTDIEAQATPRRRVNLDGSEKGKGADTGHAGCSYILSFAVRAMHV